MIIKVAEAKLGDTPKTITVHLTEPEAMIALAAADTVRQMYAEQVCRPNFKTRRAIRRGRITEKSLREHHRAAKSLQDKLGAAIVGANANELEAAIAAVREGKQNA